MPGGKIKKAAKKGIGERESSEEKTTLAIISPASFYGFYLIPMLKKVKEYRLIGIGRDDFKNIGPGNRFYPLDLTQPGADQDLTKILKQEKARIVVHLSFLETPPHNASWGHEVEAIGTLYILNSARTSGVKKIVMASTTAVYGAFPQNPHFLSEEHFLKGTMGSQLFPDRVEAEREAIKFAGQNPEIKLTILRFAPVLHRKADNFIVKYFQLPLCPTVMGFDPLWQFTHASDALNVLFKVTTAAGEGVYNIAGRGVMPLSQILKFLGKRSILLPPPALFSLGHTLWAAQLSPLPPGFCNYLRYPWSADGRRAEKELGFTPRYSILDILREFRGDMVLDPAFG
ncbi:MAG: hypothetical protein Kow0090_06660 [Myxococcota bacterium]